MQEQHDVILAQNKKIVILNDHLKDLEELKLRLSMLESVLVDKTDLNEAKE